MLVEAAQALIRLGGVATAKEICAFSSRRKLRTAVSQGRVERVARDGYKLPSLEVGSAAARLNGLISHASAATHWNWKKKCDDWRSHVTVPRGRKVAPTRRVGVHLHYRTLRPDEIDGRVTAPLRTFIDCALDLPFDEALPIADSALRAEDLTPVDLEAAAASVKGRGAARVRRVAAHADGRSANAFESALRALAIEVGLDVTPQVEIPLPGFVVHPDVVDVGRRLALEAESWEFHKGKEMFAADCRRYTLLTTARWNVLRFTWHEVMTDPDYVRGVLSAWV